MTINTEKSCFFEGLVVFECFESQSTRELGKLSEGSSVTTKDLIVTPSQLDRLWPIYRKPTLLSNGSFALLASPPLTSPPFFPPPCPSWFSHDSLTAFCSIAVFLAPITLVFILVTYFLANFVLLLAYVCDGENQQVIFSISKSVCKTMQLTEMWSRSNVTAPSLLPLIAFVRLAK